MSKPPDRFKSLEDYTPADHEARRRGEKVESDEYRAARRKALEDAGLEPDDDAPKAVEDMSPADHDRRQRGTR